MTRAELEVIRAARLYAKTLREPFGLRAFEVNYRLYRVLEAVSKLERAYERKGLPQRR